MKNAGPTVEVALDLLANAVTFLVAVDETLVVTWASRAVRKRVDGIIGMSVADAIESPDVPMQVLCQSLAEKAGQVHRFTLRPSGSPVPLAGRWLPCRDGFLFLATPDPRTSEDLSLFCLDDFPPESHVVELLAGRDETHASLEAAASASAMLTEKIRELKMSRRHLESINAAMEKEIAERRRAEEAMKGAERMLHQLLAHQEALLGAVPDILMEMNPNKVYTWANSAGIEFFGPDVVGRAAADYFDGEQNTYELVQPLFDGDADVIHVESWQRRRDGQKRLLAWRCRAIKDGEGHTVGVMSSARDITEQRQAEERLRISEERYRVLFEGSRDAIMTIEPPTWRFTSGNPAALKMFGAKTEEEFAALTPGDLSPEQQPDGRSSADKAREMIETAVRDGSHFFEWTHRRITGEVFPANVLLAKMESEGKMIVQVTVRDITERKRMEQTQERFLQRQEKLNRLQETLLAPGGLTQKLKRITDAVVDIFGADFCRIWCIGPGDLCEHGCMHALATEGPHVCRHKDKCLRLLASSGRYTHTDGVAHRRIPFGAYKIGLVASGQDHKFLTNDVVHDPRVHNHDWARELGLVSFAGYQIRPPGGETLGVLALFSKHALASEEDAQLDSLSSTAARVIQSAQFEETLRKNEERFRTVAEHTYDWEYWLTPDGKFAYCSPSCERISGYRWDEYCDDPTLLSRIVHPDDRASWDQLAPVSQGDREVRRGDYRIITRDGETRWIAHVSSPVYAGDGTYLGQRGSNRDITQRKQSEEAMIRLCEDLEAANAKLMAMQSQLVQNEKLASIGQLAAGVAHEMNTPVGFVASNFETLEGYVKKVRDLLILYDRLVPQVAPLEAPGVRSLLAEIDQFRSRTRIDFILDDIQGLFDDSREGLERVTTIVRNLRDFSRVDQPGSRDEYDLNKGIEATLVVARNEIKYAADVRTELSEVPLIFCHGGQINQVLLNILVNAAQAIKSQKRGDGDRGTITIRTRARDDGVVCEITDDGPGIAPEHLSKIFEPFFTMKPPGKGTGLGLSVSYDIIVHKHNGRLLVDSELGRGTTFTIELPIGTREDDEQETTSDGKENCVVCGR